MRGLDEYWRTPEPGNVPDSLLGPVNPEFSAQAEVADRRGLADTWGPYELVAMITNSSLNQYADSSVAGYNYVWVDSTAVRDSLTWYYVAAYSSGSYDLGTSYAGSKSPVTNTLESSNVNRNGASGLWMGTYPFATGHAYFPKTALGLKYIGAGIKAITVVDVASTETVPVRASLAQNYPNPFNPVTTIRYTVGATGGQSSVAGTVRLAVYDLLGREVSVLVQERQTPGNYEAQFDGSGLSSGVYLYRLQSGSITETRTCLLMK
ncbi:MAG: T9SS type A sorting domain-containing protein [Bacteroidetes bacterium]|nr:T9SS type A sorting domain-containing protein [Bacteroidota bacterium]